MFGLFEFARPLWLAGLAALVPVVLMALVSSTGQPLWQRAVTLVTRSLLVIAVVLALAGLSTKTPMPGRWLGIVVDQSASCDSESAARSGEFALAAAAVGEQTGFSFGREALAWDMLNGPLPVWKEGALEASNPAAALQLAAANAPDQSEAALLLLTDGRETAGDLRRAIRGLHLPIHVVPLRSGAGTQPGIVAAQMRDDGLHVTVYNPGQAGKAGIEIVQSHDKQIFATHEMMLVPGMNEAVIPLRRENKSFVLHAELRPAQSGPTKGARSFMMLQLPPTPVLVVAANADEAEPLVESLRAAGAAPEIVTPQALPSDAAKLAGNPLVVLANVKPIELSAAQAAALTAYVRERGGGLLIAGDERTFAAADYQGSPLEALAPLAAQRKTVERERSLALVLVFDRSTSMRDGNRIGFAKDAAKRAVGLLGSNDKFGVIAFGTEAAWVSDVQPCDDASKARVIAQIDELTAAGLTNMHPALERAYLALEQTPADRRHLVLLTDGVLDSKPGDFLGLAREMARSGITVSTLSVNAEAEHPLLQDIATLAKGKYARVLNPADIVAFIEGETRKAVQATRQPEKAQVYRRLPRLEIGDAPALADYAPTSPKPTAELLLMAGRRDPLLAWQREGAGVVTAFAASPNDAAWNTWPGRGAFWARLLKHTVRPVTEASQVALRRERDRVFVTVDAIDAGGHFVHGADATAHVTDLSAGGDPLKVREVALTEIAPGRYEGSYDVKTVFADVVYVEVTGPRDASPGGAPFQFKANAGITRDYPDEYIPGPPNLELLREVAAITGGKYDPKPAELFGSSERVLYRQQEWWQLLLVAAIVLFAVDLGLKRLAV